MTSAYPCRWWPVLLLIGGHFLHRASVDAGNDDGTQDKRNSPWIDPDTPLKYRNIVTFPTLPFENDVERDFALVFSDEFDAAGRSFHDGRDVRWTALHSDDLTNSPLHWYSHDAVKTENGVLNITLDIHPETFTYSKPVFDQMKAKMVTGKEVNVTKEYRSGMLQSWNKFCFTGGIIEVSAKLPGDAKTGGLWPASKFDGSIHKRVLSSFEIDSSHPLLTVNVWHQTVWMMGNLARATYLDTTDRMWPFSTNVCNKYTRYAQEISSCNDNPGFGMHPNQGRGAPEIDFFEVMMMDVFPNPLLSASLQVAPGKPKNRPTLGQKPNVTWYEPFLDNGASLNLYFFGAYTYDPNKTRAYQTDTVSINFWLNESFYTDFHKYRIEWEPPVDDMMDSPSELSRGGYIKWFIDDRMIAAMFGDDLQKVSQTEIPSEPMSVLFNLALSKDWGFPDAYFLNCEKKCWSCLDPECECALPRNFCRKNIPASYEIDYVRVYQDVNDPMHTLGCSPPTRPTAEWIEGHEERYILWNAPNGTKPLLSIQSGGANCESDVTCGGDRGTGYCDPTSKMCQCYVGWTGPSCLSAYSGQTMIESKIMAEPKTYRFLVFTGCIAMAALGVVVAWRNRNCIRWKKGYETI